ncbi:hypothetical protein FHX52_3587 [Humibacillus xanthopallidus]|uniref:Bacteriocin biosynthesis cyclodehydratase domain-containing protein n=1 Tax=Humibacillus xanthopallidus TaxID=412689 RepID=A0A543PRZ9_9MICO|nr:hypothetical protein [Humibacillus xanthopallidus]TQN46856.1 hypothetical protein FHX52_3587 [Humibacillus xanthopallidus]
MNTAHPGPYAAIPLWLRPITRRPGEVQFGVLEGGPIVTGVTPDEARLLGRLDGTMPPDALDLVARASGVSRRRWRVLLDLVGRLGLLEPVATPHPDRSDGSDRSVRSVHSVHSAAAASPAARTGSHVLVEGDGSLASDLTRLLETGAAAAPGPVDSDGVMDALRVTGDVGVMGAVGAGGSGSAQPAAVVLVADIALDPRRGDLWLRRGVPHLPVVTTGSRAVVGPLVDGTPAAPCLWCLDLHRSDRDAAWPTVMAQVATVPVDSVAPQVEPRPAADPPRAGEPGLSQLVAGTVAALVARSLAGDPPPPGVAVEVTLPWPRIDHRRWPPHPRCRHRTSRLQGGGPTPGGTASAREPGRT